MVRENSTKDNQTKWTCANCKWENRPQNEICGGWNPSYGCKARRPSEWVCLCGFRNRKENVICGGKGKLGCNAPIWDPQIPQPYWMPFDGMHTLQETPPLWAPLYQPSLGAEWKCSCGFINGERNEKCGGKGSLGCKQTRPDRWICDCGFRNKSQNKICGGYGQLGCNQVRDSESEMMRAKQRPIHSATFQES